MSKLTEQTREEIVEYLKDVRHDCMFGDGLEDDYIMDGVTIKGLNEMTDVELVDEAESCCDETDELIQKARLELAIDSAIIPPQTDEWDKTWTYIRMSYDDDVCQAVSTLVDLGRVTEVNIIINALLGGKS